MGLRSTREYMQGFAGQQRSKERIFLDAISLRLQDLASIKTKDQLELELILRTTLEFENDDDGGIDNERIFLNIMEAIKTPAYDLKFAGAKITVKNQNQRCQFGFDVDITRKFKMSSEEWRKEKRTSCCLDHHQYEVEDSDLDMWNPSIHYIFHDMIDNQDIEVFRRLLKRRWGSRYLYISESESDGQNEDADGDQDTDMESDN